MQILISILIILVIVVVGIFLITGLTGAPYVPTIRSSLEKSLDELYPLSKKDFLIDLGSGDGLVIDLATKRGARALGLELNPILAFISNLRLRKNSKASIKCCNFYHFKFPEETTVVYAFAVGIHIEPIYRKIKKEATRLGKPIYFISNAFNLAEIKPEKKVSTFYLYKIMPEA